MPWNKNILCNSITKMDQKGDFTKLQQHNFQDKPSWSYKNKPMNDSETFNAVDAHFYLQHQSASSTYWGKTIVQNIHWTIEQWGAIQHRIIVLYSKQHLIISSYSIQHCIMLFKIHHTVLYLMHVLLYSIPHVSYYCIQYNKESCLFSVQYCIIVSNTSLY